MIDDFFKRVCELTMFTEPEKFFKAYDDLVTAKKPFLCYFKCGFKVGGQYGPVIETT